MMSLLFGLAAMALGAAGIYKWHDPFILFMKGFLPVSLFLSGIVAAVVGLANLTTPRRLPPPDRDEN